MKKLISILMAVLLLLSLAACGGTKDNNPGVTDDIQNGTDEIIEDTKDKADDMIDDAKDFADDMTDNAPAEMPEDTIDGTMENTETVNPDPVQ